VYTGNFLPIGVANPADSYFPAGSVPVGECAVLLACYLHVLLIPQLLKTAAYNSFLGVTRE
jgi:hypothetical protein